tara:strand:- start:341 stop:796 length:456 start_codon:yes stop_codon:yes gene_type:complete
MKKYFIFILFYFFSSVLFSHQIIFECNITEELENGELARKKIYESKQIEIYLDKKKEWMNDEVSANWLINDDLRSRVSTSFIDNEKIITFNFKKFHSLEKKKIESSFEINFEKDLNFLKFTKFYHNWNGEVFFSSEIRGKCKERKHNLLLK